MPVPSGALPTTASDTPAAASSKPPRKRRRLLWKVVLRLLLFPAILLAFVVMLVYVPPVQHFIRARAVAYLTGRTGTKVGLDRLRIGFPLDLRLEGLFVLDQRGDTLLYAELVHADAGLRSLLGGRLLLKEVELTGVRAHLHQDADSTFNFDFIIKAFAAKEPATEVPSDTIDGFQLNVRNVHLERIRFNMALDPSELALRVDLGQLDVSMDNMAISPLRFHINEIDLRRTTVDLRTTSGDPVPPTYPALTNPLAEFDIRFKSIGVEDVRFTLATTNTGDSLWVALPSGTVDAREVISAQQRLALSKVDLSGLQFGMVGRAREEGSATKDSIPAWLDQQDGFRYWTQDWDLAVDELRLANGNIAFHTDSITPPALLFDPDHLAYTGVGLAARNVLVNNGRMAVKIDSLVVHGGTAMDRADLSAQLDATPSSLDVTDGRFTALNNSFTFRAAATPGDLSVIYRAPETVPVDAEVTGDLRPADLLTLLHHLGVELPAEAASEEQVTAKCWIKGSARSIEQAGIALDGDQGSTIHAQGRVSNAAQWPNSTYAFTVDEITLGNALREVMRAFAPADVPLPSQLSFNGRAEGNGYDVNATIDLKSDLGDLRGSAEARNWKGLLPDHLDVDLTATHIAAARFTGDTAIGPMSFALVAKGEGLHGPARRGTLALTPTVLTYRANDLSSLRLIAEVAGDSLRTELSSDADMAAFQLRTEGPWPEAGDSLAMDLDLSLLHLHLQELGITPHALNIDGRITGRIALLPDTRGRFALQASGLRAFNDERTFVMERFTLNGLLDMDSTAVELDTDIASLQYHANLSLDSTVALLRERLLSAFQEPYEFQPPQGRRIDLKVDLPGTERLASLIHPDLRAMEVKRFEGHYNSDHDSLVLNVDIPLVNYAGVEVNGLKIDLNAAGPDLRGELAVLRVTRDSLHLDDLVLEATNAPGALRTLLRLRDGVNDRYRIGVDLRREHGIAVVHVQEDLVLDRRSWQALPGNALYLDPNGLRAKDMVLSSGGQRIELRTASDGNHLDIAGFELANITGLVRSADSLAIIRGTLDASVRLPVHEGERLKAEVALHDLEIMDVDLGTVEATLEEDRKDHYRGAFLLDAGTNRAEASIEVDLSGSDARIIADGELDLKDLSLFKPLVKDHLFDLGGGLSGRLRYEQDGSAVAVLGSAAFNEGRIGLIQTGSVYRIVQDSVVFDRRGLVLNDFEVRDTKDNRFRLDGRVNTGVDQVPGLDLRLRTERFQLVNSTARDNPMFYGKLFSGIDLHIGGTAATPSVKGEVSVLDSTAISVVLPGSKVEMVDHEGIVQFTTDLDVQDSLLVKSDSEMLRDSLAAQLPGIDLDLRIKLDRRASFAIVIDPTTGDAATFRGEADLLFRYNPEGDIYLQGPFTVVDGGYTVEFYGLVKKRFDLVPGGTIIWDGDPLAGRMDIQARYSTKVAPYPLVANARGGLTESERNALQVPLPFDVMINFREAVQAPNISFGLDMDRQVRNSYPQVNSVLDQLAKPGNREELNRQVFGLLVLSTFIENETNTTQGGSSLASTAARNSVNSILTQQLNRLTGQGIKGMDIQLGVNTYDQTQGGESYSRTTVDYKVTQRVLNERVSIEAGGSVGYNERKQSVSAMSNTKAPQYAIAYDLTPDGRLRLRVYHENAYDLYDGELVNNGVAIMLTRDFEKNAKELARLREAILKQREAERNKVGEP